MKCGLAALGFVNGAIAHNQGVILKTLKDYSGQVDIVIFGEAFLQGFYAATFSPELDQAVALAVDSAPIQEIREACKTYSVGVSFGFIEQTDQVFYSSQLTIDQNGEILDLYRRVSPGWKETHAGAAYCEGEQFHSFSFQNRQIAIGLCGDLWFEDRLAEMAALAPNLIWWPVYTDFSSKEWNEEAKYDYADQVAKLPAPILYVNSFCLDKAEEEEVAKGGAVCFEVGQIRSELASGREGVLVVEC